MFPINSIGQTKIVTGQVIDSIGQYMPNIELKIKGTNLKARSNYWGTFKIAVPDALKNIVFEEMDSYHIISQKQDSENKIILTIALLSSKELLDLPISRLANIKVVTSSKKLENIEDAPNVIYAISHEDIKKYGFKTYEEILLTVPGFNIFYGDMGYFTQVRGIAPNSHNKVTYMINGRQVNQLTEANMLNGPVSFDNVERIEIIVGPGAVLYGAETLLAIVNIITKTEGDNNISISTGQDINETAAPFGHIRGNATIVKNWSERRYVNFSYNVISQDGWNAYDTINRKIVQETEKSGENIADEYQQSTYLFTKGKYDDFGVQYYSYNSNFTDINKSKDGVEGVRYDKISDFMFNFDKDWNDVINTYAQINFADKRFTRAVTKGRAMNEDLAQDSYNYEFSTNLNFEKHYIQLGTKYEQTFNRLNYAINYLPLDPAASDTNSKAQQFIKDGSVHSYGFYVSDKWTIVKGKLLFVAATRLDKSTIFESNTWYLSPRLALIGKQSRYWSTKLMFNTSTHMPDSRQSTLNMIYGAEHLDANPPWWAVTNPLVKRPERLKTYEIQNNFTFLKQNISLNTYYQELIDFISWFNPSTNMGDFYGYGCELVWDSQISRTMNMWANASYTETEFKLSAIQLNTDSGLPANKEGESVAVPKIQAAAGTDIKITQNVSVALVGRYFTKQPAFMLSFDETEDGNRKKEWGYVNNQFYADVNLLWKNIGTKGLDGSIKIKNMTNNQNLVAAQYRLYRYTPRGISALATVKYSF